MYVLEEEAVLAARVAAVRPAMRQCISDGSGGEWMCTCSRRRPARRRACKQERVTAETGHLNLEVSGCVGTPGGGRLCAARAGRAPFVRKCASDGSVTL